MSTFDPMAAAIDWLDAYRAGSLSIVDYYASDAAIECGCGGIKVLCGRTALTGYWVQRFADMPAEDLIELQTDGDGIIISYSVPDGPVHATLYFNDDGKIARSVCGPTEDISRPPSDSDPAAKDLATKKTSVGRVSIPSGQQSIQSLSPS